MLRSTTLVLALTFLAGPLCAQSAPHPRSVALTFDDLPWARDATPLDSVTARTGRILAALRRHEAPAVAFVISGRVLGRRSVDRRLDLLRMWRDAGVRLGNHSYSHLPFQTTALAEYEDDFVKGDVIPRLLMGEVGEDPHWFRPPFNQTGPTREARDAFSRFLESRGYALAPFTVEDVDYAFDLLYGTAAGAGDVGREDRVGRAYLTHLDTMMAFAEKLARETFGREIPQVLLLHANDLNARYMEAILERLEARGYRFITLDEAVRDPAYATQDGYVGSHGISWLHRWRMSLGLPDRLRDEPDPPGWVLRDYQRLHAGGGG